MCLTLVQLSEICLEKCIEVYLSKKGHIFCLKPLCELCDTHGMSVICISDIDSKSVEVKKERKILGTLV